MTSPQRVAAVPRHAAAAQAEAGPRPRVLPVRAAAAGQAAAPPRHHRGQHGGSAARASVINLHLSSSLRFCTRKMCNSNVRKILKLYIKRPDIEE